MYSHMVFVLVNMNMYIKIRNSECRDMKASHDIQLQGKKFLNIRYLHRSEHQQLKTKPKRMVIYQKP